ncbi:MAG: hypothetical protein AAFU86_13920 [Pseudomonadota bacterium]
MTGEQPQPNHAQSGEPHRARHDDPCRRELLISAADGVLPDDLSLERRLDHLERAR